jgi:hypothetical protein
MPHSRFDMGGPPVLLWLLAGLAVWGVIGALVLGGIALGRLL